KYFCDRCLSKVRLDDEWRCSECNEKSIGGVTHFGCRNKDSLDGMVSFLAYKGLIGAGIRSLKYKFLRKLEDEFYKIFLSAVKNKLKSNQAADLIDFLKLKPVVVPVPLYWRKLNYRGFNQAGVMGEMIAKIFDFKLKDKVLVRKKQTKPQAKLSKRERRENLKLAFVIGERKIFENVLLVDDVWTTGETMRSAGRVLKKSGVKRVWGLTLAR
ncbi:MAG: ComF family protein, partial [Candidatus Beckwithbacteria bacterium]